MREIQLLFTAIMFSGVVGSTVGYDGQDAKIAENDAYEFVEDTSRWVMVIQGKTESIGKLDAAGNFIPDKRMFQLRKGQPLSLMPDYTLINGSAQKEVYEFRSRRLIPGEIDEEGNFIPALGGKIIDFKEYRYSPKAAKIYNLPGKFVKKEKKDSRK